MKAPVILRPLEDRVLVSRGLVSADVRLVHRFDGGPLDGPFNAVDADLVEALAAYRRWLWNQWTKRAEAHNAVQWMARRVRRGQVVTIATQRETDPGPADVVRRMVLWVVEQGRTV